MYVPAHVELADHPKMIRLCRLRHERRHEVIGRLLLLWWWAMKYAPDGDLSLFTAEEIAMAVDLSPQFGELWLSQLREAGWLDAGDQLHDWWEYGGAYIRKKEETARRMRDYRAGKRSPNGQHGDNDDDLEDEEPAEQAARPARPRRRTPFKD